MPILSTLKNHLSTPHGQAHEASLHLYSKGVFSWTAPEYLQHPKSRRWYIIAACVLAVMIVLALLLKDWTLALALLVFGPVYYYFQEYHSPRQVSVVISDMGIKVGNQVYPYTHIKAFWIMYHPPFLKTLNLSIHKKTFSDVIIQLEDQDPVALRHFLCGQIHEWEGKNERLSEIILRILKL